MGALMERERVYFISIHAPREGGDSKAKLVDKSGKISIHAPREGGDRQLRAHLHAAHEFNPPPPRGGRRW